MGRMSVDTQAKKLFFVLLGATPVMPRNFWLCTHKSLLAGLRDLAGVATGKANTLPAVLSLWPLEPRS